MQPSATRVASRHLASNTRRVIEDAIRPVYTGDPEDIDMTAERVMDNLTSGLRTVLSDPLSKMKVVSFGPEAEGWDSFDSNNGYRPQHYWAKVEYPTWAKLTYGFKVNVAKRWKEALHLTKLPDVSLSGPVLQAITEMCAEVAREEAPPGPPGYHPIHDPFLIEKIEDEMGRRHVFNTEAESYEINFKEEEEKHVETWEVDARLKFTMDEVEATAIPEGTSQVMVRYNIKVRISFDEIVSPWAHNYLEPRP